MTPCHAIFFESEGRARSNYKSAEQPRVRSLNEWGGDLDAEFLIAVKSLMKKQE